MTLLLYRPGIPHIAFSVWVGIVVFPSQAVACIQCTNSFLDLALPPVGMWYFFIPAWYLCQALAIRFSRTKTPRVTARWTVGVWALISFVVAAAGAGPVLAYIPIGVSTLVAFYLVLVQGNRGEQSNKPVLIVGAVFLTIGLYWLAGGLHVKRNRSLAEYMHQWPCVSGSRMVFEKAKKSIPEDVQLYRNALELGVQCLDEDLAARLAEVGDPAVDIPILERKLAEARLEEDSLIEQMAFEDAIQNLSGLVAAPEQYLSDSELLTIATSEYDKKLFLAKAESLGRHRGTDVIADYPCSDICPLNTKRIIHLNMLKDECELVLGEIQGVEIYQGTAAVEREYCFPKVLIKNWDSIVW